MPSHSQIFLNVSHYCNFHISQIFQVLRLSQTFTFVYIFIETETVEITSVIIHLIIPQPFIDNNNKSKLEQFFQNFQKQDLKLLLT